MRTPAPPRPATHTPTDECTDTHADKRAAILAAARRRIARSGLHDTPMSALAREAGVAAGTLYLYFPSKAAMINTLYVELLEERQRAAAAGGPPTAGRAAPARNALWRSWHGFARWHLDHPEASNVIAQCEASAILTETARGAARRVNADGLARFEAAVARGALRAMPYAAFDALFAGPIAALVRMRDAGKAGETEVTDAVLRATFEGVCRGVLPPDGPGPETSPRTPPAGPGRAAPPRLDTGGESARRLG